MWVTVAGGDFERWAVGPGEWLVIRRGWVMPVRGVFRVRGLVTCQGILRVRR